MHDTRRRQVLTKLAALVAGGCLPALQSCQAVTRSSVTERLDTATGMTIGTAEQAMVFARTEARYSRSARDYLYLGPVETNRQGLREYYLWVGVATTLDRGFLAPETAPPSSLQIMVRDEPMEFALRPWSELVPGSAAAAAYRTPVDLTAQLGARVTRDQLRLLAEAAPRSIRTATGEDGDGARRYEAWGDRVGWPVFPATN